MKLQLKELFEILGEVKEFDFEIPAEELNENSSYVFETPIKVKGFVENRAGVITLRYSTGFSLLLTCDRCLKEFVKEFEFSFEHTLVRKVYNEDEDYVVCEDNTLDMNELALSDSLLQLPTKILCREDCKGLCPKCGKDLNEGDCECDLIYDED